MWEQGGRWLGGEESHFGLKELGTSVSKAGLKTSIDFHPSKAQGMNAGMVWSKVGKIGQNHSFIQHLPHARHCSRYCE